MNEPVVRKYHSIDASPLAGFGYTATVEEP